jgi:hypothetical protein
MAVIEALAAAQIDYSDLYARWERGNWRATEVDFTRDKVDWQEGFDEMERRAAVWTYSMFFYGEDRVAADLSPYIDAAPREEQKYFLATQQVDEARHAVFFARFWREVVEQGDTIAESLASTVPQLSWGFRMVFDRLDRMADELRRDRSPQKLAQAVTLYHLLVEGTLAQPGQRLIEQHLESRRLLPGFRAGIANVERDEQRHIAFGVKLVSDLVAEEPECRDAVAELIRDVLPHSTAVYVPPGWDPRYAEAMGATIEEQHAAGNQAFEQKLRAAGVALETLPGPQLVPLDLTPRERAEEALVLLRAGILGEKNGPASPEGDAQRIFFDAIARAADVREAPEGTLTVQWVFDDAAPWHVRVSPAQAVAADGVTESADVTVRGRFDDWVDVATGRTSPLRSLATRRLRLRGSPAALLRLGRVFPV